LDFDPVAEAGENDQALKQMIAVGTPAGDMQRQIYLGRRKPCPGCGILSVGC